MGADFSIHALLAESDRMAGSIHNIFIFSIHALLAESDPRLFPSSVLICVFLSTLSLRRATASSEHSSASCSIFYPRSPCGERRFHFNAGQHICVFSIHALLAESDSRAFWQLLGLMIFLSTLSLRRATSDIVTIKQEAIFSIHALLAESDTALEIP